MISKERYFRLLEYGPKLTPEDWLRLRGWEPRPRYIAAAVRFAYRGR